MKDIFISYARKDDEPFVRRLYEDLTARGFDVWWDRVSMPSRALKFLQEIRDAITAHDRLILVVGPGAVESDYVRAEWKYALSICKAINPVLRIGAYDLLPPELRGYDAPDFRNDAEYENRLEQLVRQISEPIAPLSKLVGVPELPPHFLARQDDLKGIKAAILADIDKPVVVTGTARRVGLHGMGGIGKSVLAAALARDCETRRAFRDGLFWVTVGQSPNLRARLSDLCRALGDPPQTFDDVAAGTARLSELLAEKACLLIIDDVWQTEHAQAFDALGPRCRMLVTTRDAGLITALGAIEQRVDVLCEEDALTLMARWMLSSDITPDYEEHERITQAKAELPKTAREVAKECDNLPLALALCAAQVRDGTSWEDLLEALREADLEFIDHPHGSVLKSLKVSVDALTAENPAHATHYGELAIFPEDVAIPEETVLTLWLHTNGLNARSARKLLTTLSTKALIQFESRGESRLVSLHDLQHDYLRVALENADVVHGELVEAYRTTCDGVWHEGPDDGYFFQHLAYHMVHAGYINELYTLLTGSPDWMGAKFIACTGDASYVADVELAMQQGPGLLALTQLHAARQVVHTRVGVYTDTDLKTLVWLGRKAEALAHARMRGETQERYMGLMAVYEVSMEGDRPDLTLLEEALTVARSIEDAWSQTHALMDVAVALAQADDPRGDGVFSEALAVAQGIEDALYRVNALRDLAEAIPQAGDPRVDRVLDEALAVAQGIKGAERRAFAASAVATVLTQTGDPRGETVFEEALAIARGIEDAERRSDSLKDVAAALTQAGDPRGRVAFDEALAAAQDINPLRVKELIYGEKEVLFYLRITERMRLREHVLRAVAVALNRAGDHRAEKAFDEALAIARDVEDAWIREDALRDVVVAMVQAGEIEEALAVARGIENAERRAGALSAVALSLTSDPRGEAVFNEALAVARDIEDAGRRAGALSAVALSLTSDPRGEAVLNEALAVARDIEENWRRGRALKDVATALAQAGVIEEALTIAQGIEDARYRADALSDVVVALNRAGDPRAKKAFEERVVAAQGIEEDLSLPRALSAVAAAVAQVGKIDEAAAVARSIADAEYRAYALSAVAAMLAQVGNPLSDVVFDEALNAARGIKKDWGRTDATDVLRDVVAAIAQAGKIDEALTVARGVEEGWARARVLSAVVAPMAQAGVIEEALTIARGIEDARYRADALSAVAAMLAQVGNPLSDVVFDEALNAARGIDHPFAFPMDALRDVVAAIAQAGKIDEALTVARGVEEGWARARVLSAVVAPMAQAGVIEEALTIAQGIEDARYRADALSAVAAMLAQVGNPLSDVVFDEALNAARGIEIDHERMDALRDVVAAMARVGEIEEALAVARSTADAEYRADALRDVATALAQKELFAGALDAFGPRDLSEFLQSLAGWADSFEKVESGLSVAVLREAARIISWVQPSWRPIYGILAKG